MDATQCMALARSLLSRGTRRGLLRGVAGGALGAAMAADAGDARRGRRKRRPPKAPGQHGPGGPGGGDADGNGGNAPPRSGAARCTVCKDQDDCPFTSIQAAIDAAAAGSTIVICKGHYNGDIAITKNLTLTAAAGDEVELDGSGETSVVTVPAGVTATLQGLEITDGKGTVSFVLDDGAPVGFVRQGGAIFNRGDLTLTRLRIHDNRADEGGAIWNGRGARLRLVQTVVQENDARSQGGAIYNIGTLTVANGSRIAENEAGVDGGGLFNEGGVVTIIGGSRVEENQADQWGGGIYNGPNGTVTIDGSAVRRNTAKEQGGGIANAPNTTLILQNHAEIGRNKAHGAGGGIDNGGAVTLRSSTIVANEADIGGGIFNVAGTVTLQSSTIRENEAESGGGIANRRDGAVTLDAQSAVVDNEPDNCAGTTACAA